MQQSKDGRRLTTCVEHKWFPVAVLPGASSFEMSITSGKFDAEIFSMANATKYEEKTDYAMPTAERHTPDATTHKVTLLHKAIDDSVSINGLEESDENTVAEGKFKVATETVESEQVTTITFNDNFAGENVEIIYDYAKTVQEAIIDNKSSAIGEASLIWPVYGSGDDCTESAIIGYYIVKVFRARITQQPGLDTSLACLRDAA